MLSQQTLHLLVGFIGEPARYFQSEANSGLLDTYMYTPINQEAGVERLEDDTSLSRAIAETRP